METLSEGSTTMAFGKVKEAVAVMVVETIAAVVATADF